LRSPRSVVRQKFNLNLDPELVRMREFSRIRQEQTIYLQTIYQLDSL